MSTTRSLYKAKPKGLGSRDVRATLKSQESRSGRDALLSSRRGIPLAAVQEEVPPKKKGGNIQERERGGGGRERERDAHYLLPFLLFPFPHSLPLTLISLPPLSLVTDRKSQLERLQKLREWQEKRNQAKEKEKLTSKRPFNYGGGRSKSKVLKANSDQMTVGKKSTTIQTGNANTTKSCLAPNKRSVVKPRATKDPVCHIPPKSTAMANSGMPLKPKKKTAAKEAPPPPTRTSRPISEQSREKNVNSSTTTSRRIADQSREKNINPSTTISRQPRVNGKNVSQKVRKGSPSHP